MERPERPSRHKSNPVKFPVRPTFSSDSESEVNDSDGPIQITFYRTTDTESSVVDRNIGPSTSSVPQRNSPPVAENSSSTMMRGSPVPLRMTISPTSVASHEEEPRSEQTQEIIRRKRSAASSAASVIFDSVDTLIGSNSCSRNNNSPERFQSGEYVIRPKSFCNMGDVWHTNAIRPPNYKISRRHNGPIDLTPNTPNRDSSTQSPPVVTSGFSLPDNLTLPTNTETTTQNKFFTRNNVPPDVVQPRSSQQLSASSSILRHFDELCSTNSSNCAPTVTRRRRYVRFMEGSRFPDGQSTPPSSLRNTLDDYCDLVGNFLFNYPSTSQTTESRRSPPVAMPLDRASVSEPQAPSTADIIDRHAISIISEINSYLDPPEHTPVIDAGEPMEQSNDDVIVVEPPVRPPLPGSPDSYIVPSSRTPSPAPRPPVPVNPPPPINSPTPSSPVTTPRQDKPQSSRAINVPLTLTELNQSLVNLLECPVCFDHATPPIYQCIKGHILCQNCHPRLTFCPICRSRLPGDRNSVMEKVAEKLMYPCKNTVTGCTMMLKLDDKQAHEEGCGFRHYACIVPACSWKGYKPELVVHLQSNHPDKLITGDTKELHVPISGSGFIVHHWIQSAHNEVFHVVFNVDTFKRIMKGCVIYVGSREKAEQFEYTFQLKQRVSPKRRLSYARSTHVDTLKQGLALCLRDDFSINIDMAQLYRPTDCCAQVIPIFITITHAE